MSNQVFSNITRRTKYSSFPSVDGLFRIIKGLDTIEATGVRTTLILTETPTETGISGVLYDNTTGLITFDRTGIFNLRCCVTWDTPSVPDTARFLTLSDSSGVLGVDSFYVSNTPSTTSVNFTSISATIFVDQDDLDAGRQLAFIFFNTDGGSPNIVGTATAPFTPTQLEIRRYS